MPLRVPISCAPTRGAAGLKSADAPTLVVGAQDLVDLLPVPAAVAARTADGVDTLAANCACSAAGLSRLDPIADELRAFLDGTLPSRAFMWETGSAVDRRSYHVQLTRRLRLEGAQCLVTLIDRTSEAQTERNLRREMLSDSLTGLPNRAGFSERLEELLELPGERARNAVLMLDLDRFSRVNACLGSLAGDELLITFARRVKSALRGHDLLARTGGDEFAVLVRIERPGDAEQVADRITRALTHPFRLSDFEFRLGCAIGIAHGGGTTADAEELIRHAQFALKRSKTSGRPEVYQLSAFHLARAEFGMETALRRAIEADQLSMHFQPICDLSTGRVVSFEALARWTDTEGRVQSPDHFIPVAESSGLIVPLGRWAIETAAKTLTEWDAAPAGAGGVCLAVNLSAIQLQRDSIPGFVEATLQRYDLQGDRLTLELTESALVSDPDGVARVMRALKELGTTLAMDDFGTGYSNLAYLQKLPIDLLKIDRSFVTNMLADRDKVAIVRAILSLAQALGMHTTAEGIESNDLAQTLAALGCTYGQGFAYAPALPAAEAYSYLAARNAVATAASAS